MTDEELKNTEEKSEKTTDEKLKNTEEKSGKTTDGKIPWNDIVKPIVWISKHKISVLSAIAFIYLLFYSIYSLNQDLKCYLNKYEDLIKYFSQISILLFTSGIFAASLKYLQLLNIFKDQFAEYIESSKFDEKLKHNLKLITFSDDYLIQQNDLSRLWTQISLCMYKKEFPTIYEKLNQKIRNHFFNKSNISYYYKNFQINYYLEKFDDNSIKIVEKSSYTIVRPNIDKFVWDFGYKGDSRDKNNKEISIEVKILQNVEIPNISVNYENDALIDETNKLFNLKISHELSGHLEYHVERKTVTVQDINIDRIRTFGSDRIIDDLSYIVTHDANVNVSTHSLGDNKFYHNGAYDDDVKAFINRDVFLPGQKFLLVFTLN